MPLSNTEKQSVSSELISRLVVVLFQRNLQINQVQLLMQCRFTNEEFGTNFSNSFGQAVRHCYNNSSRAMIYSSTRLELNWLFWLTWSPNQSESQVGYTQLDLTLRCAYKCLSVITGMSRVIIMQSRVKLRSDFP